MPHATHATAARTAPATLKKKVTSVKAPNDRAEKKEKFVKALRIDKQNHHSRAKDLFDLDIDDGSNITGGEKLTKEAKTSSFYEEHVGLHAFVLTEAFNKGDSHVVRLIKDIVQRDDLVEPYLNIPCRN